MPWLLDTLDPDGYPLPGDPHADGLHVGPCADDPMVFDTYVGTHSLLLAHGEVKRRNPQR